VSESAGAQPLTRESPIALKVAQSSFARILYLLSLGTRRKPAIHAIPTGNFYATDVSSSDMISSGTGIDASRARYPLSIDGIRAVGLVDTDPEKSPPLVWIDGILTPSEASTLLDYQRVNKIPGMDFLCYKSTLFGELNIIRSLFPWLYEFYPHSYLLPDDLLDLEREHSFICGRTASAPVWVVKPRSGSCGKGIQLIQSVQEAEAVTTPSVAQLLVNPFLLNDRKFDFRFFLLISSLEPFSAFIYKEGIARFCTQPYIVPTKSNLDHPFSHLTNTAINKQTEANPEEFTKPASEVLRQVGTRLPPANRLWEEICHISAMTLVGIYPSILACLPMGEASRPKLIDQDVPVITVPHSHLYLRTANQFPFLGALSQKQPLKIKKKVKGRLVKKGRKVAPLPPRPTEPEPELESPVDDILPSREPIDYHDRVLTPAQHYFHILGIDIILDSKGHPKLLELNDRPSLQVTASFELPLKQEMISEAFSHISLDGSSFGENENSKWQQILPITKNSELSATVHAIMQHRSEVKYRPKAGVNSSSTQRMLDAGVKPELHEMYRARFIGPHLPRISDEKDDGM
jgi:hypothetical protein